MATTKIDLRRERPELYSPGREPAMIEVPELSFLMIDGHGDPNRAPEYVEAVQALFAVAYAAKFAVRRGPGGLDHVVMPMEGLWWTPDMSAFDAEDKSAWDWTMLIRQPEQVTADVFDEATTVAAGKKPAPSALGRVRLERFAEGRAAQVMHVGPYAEEGPTIRGLHDFIAEQGWTLAGKHHEIYLNDPRRAAPEKMKTIVRQPVAAAS